MQFSTSNLFQTSKLNFSFTVGKVQRLERLICSSCRWFVCWAKSEVQQPEIWGSVQLHCGSDFSIDELTCLLVVVCKLLYKIVQMPPKMFPGSCLCLYIASSIQSIEGFILPSATKNSFHSIPLVILRWTVTHFVVEVKL